MADASPDHDGAPQDAVATARAQADEADRLVRSGRLDDDAARELEIATSQLRADLTNGENPEASLDRIRRLIDRRGTGEATDTG